MSDLPGRRLLVAGLSALLLGVTLAGVLTGPAAPRDRAVDLERRLRCPVCKTVSIAESPSETAAVARQVVREQVSAGRTDEQVLQYFRARYGEWILLDPEPVGRNLLLFALPALAAVVGLALVVSRRGTPSPAVPVPPEVREQIAVGLATLRERDQDDAP